MVEVTKKLITQIASLLFGVVFFSFLTWILVIKKESEPVSPPTAHTEPTLDPVECQKIIDEKHKLCKPGEECCYLQGMEWVHGKYPTEEEKKSCKNKNTGMCRLCGRSGVVEGSNGYEQCQNCEESWVETFARKCTSLDFFNNLRVDN